MRKVKKANMSKVKKANMRKVRNIKYEEIERREKWSLKPNQQIARPPPSDIFA